MENSLDGGYDVKAFHAELKRRMEGMPSYLRDGRFVNSGNDIEGIVKGNITYYLKELFVGFSINEDAIEVVYDEESSNVNVHFRDDIINTPAQMALFIERYKEVMGQLPPMTMTFNKPITRQTITIEVGK